MTDLINSFRFDHNGRKFLARVYRDDNMRRPWEEDETHGDIREGYTGFAGYAEKKGGEVVISDDRFSVRRTQVWLYNVESTIKRARKDGWGLTEENMTALAERLFRERKLTGSITLTKREIVAEAVRLDMERMRAWLNDGWHWCGVSVVEMPDYSKAIEALEAYDHTVTDGDDWQTEAVEALRDMERREPGEDYSNAIWGIESDAGDYFMEVAKELADQI